MVKIDDFALLCGAEIVRSGESKISAIERTYAWFLKTLLFTCATSSHISYRNASKFVITCARHGEERLSGFWHVLRMRRYS